MPRLDTPTPALIFTPAELTDKARSFLEHGFVTVDFKGYWCDIDSVLDAIAEDGFTGVKLPAGFNWGKKPLLADLPPIWWKAMGFSPKMERAMKAFWKKHPTGEIKWEW